MNLLGQAYLKERYQSVFGAQSWRMGAQLILIGIGSPLKRLSETKVRPFAANGHQMLNCHVSDLSHFLCLLPSGFLKTQNFDACNFSFLISCFN